MNRILFLSIVATLIFASDICGQSWQSSLSNNEPIRLAIRDKYGKEVYEATFIVRAPDNDETFIKQIRIRADDWGEVFYPSDFDGANETVHALSQRQFFEWECLVKGKRALSGTFYYPNFELDIEGNHNEPIPYAVEGLKREIVSKPARSPKSDVNATVRARITVSPAGEIIQIIPLMKGNPRVENLVIDALGDLRFAPLPSDAPQENQTGTITFRFRKE